jgi:hypothetical protein
MMTEEERFGTDKPDLCQGLRWKGMFYTSEPDPSVPSMSARLFWCTYTQTCLGPDGEVAEPGSCSSGERRCYGNGGRE